MITAGKVLHLGTYNGNPLVMAGDQGGAGRGLHAGGHRTTRSTATVATSTRCDDIIDERGLPAHTVQFGAKGCITWSPEPVRNYRDYKATDFDLAFAQLDRGASTAGCCCRRASTSSG